MYTTGLCIRAYLTFGIIRKKGGAICKIFYIIVFSSIFNLNLTKFNIKEDELNKKQQYDIFTTLMQRCRRCRSSKQHVRKKDDFWAGQCVRVFTRVSSQSISTDHCLRDCSPSIKKNFSVVLTGLYCMLFLLYLTVPVLTGFHGTLSYCTLLFMFCTLMSVYLTAFYCTYQYNTLLHIVLNVPYCKLFLLLITVRHSQCTCYETGAQP